MAKFNQASKTRTGVQSPIKSVANPDRVTGNGALAYSRTPQSELFLLAVANFVGKDTFYEDAKQRDNRFSTLVRQVALEDPRWTLGFIGWLRNEAFMRSASVVAAVEAGQAYKALGEDKTENWSREFVVAAQARADEPGEVFAYYESKYGKPFPAWLKKGVADGARKLYNEYSLLKYDTDSKGYRFADVLQLSHAKAEGDTQNRLFKYAIDSRYGNKYDGWNDGLVMVRSRNFVMSVPVEERREFLLNRSEWFQKAGMTWEALSGWLQGPMDAAAWEAIIPSMGHMALIRNLRNFLQAGVSASVMKGVLAKISDPAQVAKGKQFPFRYLAAYQANKGNLKIAAALEEALEASLSNVPALSGRTLILVDRSGSMFNYHGSDQELTMADKAAIFGSALALRAENADLVQFGSAWRGPAYESVSFRKGDSLLPMLDKFRDMGGTETYAAVKGTYKGHDRVIIITDEQYGSGWGSRGGDPSDAVPAKIPLYTWNLQGYGVGGKSGNLKRHTFGGLTDKAFVQVPMIEAGQNAVWPWELDTKR
jgi:hypothetical protein